MIDLNSIRLSWKEVFSIWIFLRLLT